MKILAEFFDARFSQFREQSKWIIGKKDSTNNNSRNVILKGDESANINQNEAECGNDLTIETTWTDNQEEEKDKNQNEGETIEEQKGDNRINSFFWDSSSKVKFWEIERDFNKLLLSFVTNPFDFEEEAKQVENGARKLAKILTVPRCIANKLPKLSDIDTKLFKKSHSLNYEKQMKHKRI